MTEERHGIVCRDVAVEPEDSHEYEFAAVATATVDGPGGTYRLQRRYQGLPYHNDVVDPDAVDSNDELVDRPNEVHVHTKVYATDADEEEYRFDDHETWSPPDATVLGDEGTFLEASRAHHVSGVRAVYDRAVEDASDRRR